MHSKIINPQLHGKAVYENKGSCKRLVAYLQHEVKDRDERLKFFDQGSDDVAAGEVQQRIDGNVKGLRSGESKFITLVLSPSRDELQHIGNSPEKLKQFTRQAMQHYAENFYLSSGKKLGAEDLLWFAAIHHGRAYKGTEQDVKCGLTVPGTLKPGLNMHVHVLVSKRDRDQQITLSPFGNRDRFDMNTWQGLNQQSFNRLFGYQALERAPASKLQVDGQRDRTNAYIAGKVGEINLYLDKPHKLELEQVLAVAEKRQYHKTFFFNLYRLENMLKQDRYVRDPMHLLEHNRDRKLETVKVDYTFSNSLSKLAEAGRQMGFTEPLTLRKYMYPRRKRKGLAQA